VKYFFKRNDGGKHSTIFFGFFEKNYNFFFQPLDRRDNTLRMTHDVHARMSR